MKIVVLGGGRSDERDISLASSAAILDVLREQGHKAVFVDLFLGKKNWNGRDAIFDANDGLACDLIKSRSLSRQEINTMYRARGYVLGSNVLQICRCADFVFLALHGEDGEDGKIQSVLDLIGVPYNGSGTLGSALAMDKGMARQIMQENGVSVAPLVQDAPCVVKRINGGSSIDVKICDTDEELQAVLPQIQAERDAYLIERKIEGTEVTVSVLDGKALAPVELVTPDGYTLDYTVKYAKGETGVQEICPARISEGSTEEVKALAAKLYRVMKLSGYSRTDFIIDRQNKVWCLEVNTLPGFTKTSALPLAAAYEGIDIGTLCEKLIDLGIQRAAKQKQLRDEEA